MAPKEPHWKGQRRVNFSAVGFISEDDMRRLNLVDHDSCGKSVHLKGQKIVLYHYFWAWRRS